MSLQRRCKQRLYDRSPSRKFLNKITQWAVFMIEDRRVLAREAILSSAAAGECGRDQAIETLVREHSRLVYRIAYAVLRQHQDAEDATQEAFVRVLRYSSRLALVENPKTWLARIAWRVAVNRNKRRGHEQAIPLEDHKMGMPEIASSEVGADATLQGRQLATEIEKLITALPQKLRAPLVLSTLQEMTPREIAATLNINEAAVRSRVFRARQILKEKLAQRGHR
jgi:RNA polymerase sigma-70 factor (ECF subfamily)